MFKEEDLSVNFSIFQNFLKKTGILNGHHLVLKSRGGTCDIKNILQLDIKRHAAWHKLFGRMNIDEVIAFCKKMDSKKVLSKTERAYWDFLFVRYNEPQEVVRLLVKVQDFKKRWRRKIKLQVTKRATELAIQEWKRQFDY